MKSSAVARIISLDELEHIYRVIEILRRTIELIKELEAIEPGLYSAKYYKISNILGG